MLGRIVTPVARQALRARPNTAVRTRGDHNFQAPGESIPFSTENKAKTFAYVWGYLGFGFAIPFIAGKFSMQAKGIPCKW